MLLHPPPRRLYGLLGLFLGFPGCFLAVGVFTLSRGLSCHFQYNSMSLIRTVSMETSSEIFSKAGSKFITS